ncbi:hypothetical protein BDR26DRAFT_863962 [Obelidium mucronatum]|nr:hypothetical protein BDR26DRAFT_863962 [Obelidium mucronatum]
MVATLLASGAENVLINNMAPLHLSPRMKPFQALSAQIKMVVDGYNQVLAAGVASLSTHFPKANIAINDINGLLTLVASPEGAVSFKYANVDGSCFNYTAQTVCAAPDTYFFWDGIHPSTRGQDLMAQYGFNQLFKLPGYFIAKPATTTATTVESLYKPTQAPSVRPITNLYSSASALAGITLFSVALSSLLL